MNKKQPARFFVVCLLLSINIPVFAQLGGIELKNNFFYVDGKKFFVKGIGYEAGAIPGQLPWNRAFDEDLLRFDMERIAGAGFNTIRTWGAFTDAELEVIREYDLKIIMGIWIDPHGNFSDPAFVLEAKQIVEEVLKYSGKYDHILAYLIMNEPLPETIFREGLENTKNLWAELSAMIHEQHPGIPVSIANTCTGVFLDPELFDFSAYNVYPYNPSTVNHSHGYSPYIEFLSNLRSDNHPLIVTEYGLSVSPAGPGNFGYGGNTAIEQATGILEMYRGLIDGGASGSCVFNYSDGWWKGGNEFEHDDSVEEWFGLVEYDQLNDKYGTPRPVWDSLQKYQTAIIALPRNSAAYSRWIPVEIFTNNQIASFEIHKDSEVIFSAPIDGDYFTDSIEVASGDFMDVQYLFRFFDAEHQEVKRETITFLTHEQTIEWPTIAMNVSPEYLSSSGFVNADYHIQGQGMFTTDNLVDHVFYPHTGFEYGNAYQENAVNGLDDFNFSKQFYYGEDVHVITLALGFDIYYGNFAKRIYNQEILLHEDINTVVPIVMQEDMFPDLSIYPNAAKHNFQIAGLPTDITRGLVSIIDLNGNLVKEINPAHYLKSNEIKINELKPGVYFVSICVEDRCVIKRLVKL